MKKLILAAAIAALVPSTLFAADLPLRSAPPVFVPPPLPSFSWTGFYIGANAGYAFNGRNDYNLSSTDPGLASLVGIIRPNFLHTNAAGFTGGGQIGYNYQLGTGFLNFGGGGVVIGIEADAAYTGQKGAATAVDPFGDASTFRSRTDFVGTVRGRLGYAFDNLLVYGTGGFAYGGVRQNVNFFAPPLLGSGLLYSGSQNSIRTGYAYGGGLEYAIPTTSFLNVFKSSAVSLKVEFIHYDLGSRNLLIANTFNGPGYSERIHTQGNLIRAGINYKFETFAPAAPIIARY